jgi:glycosyltransferase involved in cell wall biosynthesis
VTTKPGKFIPPVELHDHGDLIIVSQVRVLHVINQLGGHGGAEVSLRENVLGSADAGIIHAIVVLRNRDNDLESFRAANVAVFAPEHEFGRRGAYQHVRTAIEAFRPTLVHTSLFDADLVGRLAGLRTKTPVVSSFVNTPYDPHAAVVEDVSGFKRAGVRRVDKYLARNATTAFHAISQATADHATTHLGIDPQMVRIVPRGRSAAALGKRTAERRAAVRDRLKWGDAPIILNVARQEPQKGHLLLVAAMADVLEVRPDAQLILVGRDGRSTPALSAKVSELGIDDAVTRLGVRTDVADLLAAADVFAFSSLYEGLGGSVVEAAGVGVPVVAFDVPAVREVLGDAHPWLVPIGDTALLGRALQQVLSGGVEVQRAALAGRERFLDRYELNICVSGMCELYRDVDAGIRGHRWSRLARPPRVRVDNR